MVAEVYLHAEVTWLLVSKTRTEEKLQQNKLKVWEYQNRRPNNVVICKLGKIETAYHSSPTAMTERIPVRCAKTAAKQRRKSCLLFPQPGMLGLQTHETCFC